MQKSLSTGHQNTMSNPNNTLPVNQEEIVNLSLKKFPISSPKNARKRPRGGLMSTLT